MYPHPPRRHIKDFTDALMKIADILYFLKEGSADKEKTEKRIIFLKAVLKKRLKDDELESLNKEIENVRELLESFGKRTYEEYLKYLKKKYPEVIERFERSKKSSLLEFIK